VQRLPSSVGEDRDIVTRAGVWVIRTKAERSRTLDHALGELLDKFVRICRGVELVRGVAQSVESPSPTLLKLGALNLEAHETQSSRGRSKARIVSRMNFT